MEVLIIGAGVAGLAAARILAAAGVKTQIIEARDRIGGRVWTVPAGESGAPIELGAEFIHGRPPDLLDLIAAAELDIAAMPDKHEYLRDGPRVNGENLFRQVDQIFNRLADPKLADQTFSEFLTHIGADAEVRDLALNYVEGFNAARADRISTRSLAFESRAQEAIGGEQAFRVRVGYNRVTQWLWNDCASNTQMSLSTLVESVEWRRGLVTIKARSLSGDSITVTASRAIITLPLGVLKLPGNDPGAVAVRPRPAWLQGALDRLEMGQAVRVTFILTPSFWHDHPQLIDAGFIHTDSEDFPTWWTTLAGPTRGLTGWAGGSKAEKVATFTDEEIASRGIHSLASIVEGSREAIAGQVESWHLHNWAQDPFARGAYSYAGVGGLEAREQLARPVEDTLYFAGEATDTEGHGATVHGALASGYRAAHQILAGS